MTNQLWDARVSAVISAVRREITRRAMKSVRAQVVAAEGDARNGVAARLSAFANQP